MHLEVPLDPSVSFTLQLQQHTEPFVACYLHVFWDFPDISASIDTKRTVWNQS